MLPTVRNIRLRFLFTYGTYIIIVMLLWAYTRIPFIYVLPLLIALFVVGRFNYRTNVKVLTRRPYSRNGGFDGFVGKAITDIGASGKVSVRGEIWKAQSKKPIAEGADIVVTGIIDGLVLVVQEHREDE